MTIERHPFARRDAAQLVEEFKASLFSTAARLAALPSPIVALSGMLSDALALASAAAVCEERVLAKRAFGVMGGATCAIFLLGARRGDVSVAIDGRTMTLHTDEPHAYADAVRWLDGYAAVSATRHVEDARLLVDTASAALFEQSAARQGTRRSTLKLALAILAYARGEARFVVDDALDAVADSSREEKSHAPQAANYLHEQLDPLVPIVRALAASDSKAFNVALVSCLERHRAFWSRDEDHRENPDGWLALRPLGLTALARDRGMPIDVESDYIPSWLVRGDD